MGKIQGVTITDTNGGFPVIVTVDGYTFEIDDKGNVNSKDGNQDGGDTPNPPVEEIGIKATDIASSSDKSEYYGASVTGYTCANSAGVNAWKIFYADSSNIYLIADDYIHYDYCPPSANQTIYKNSDYSLSMDNVIKDYSGSSDITDEKIKALNNDYFTKGYSSTNNNMKAVAYMLDTNVWSVYKGEKAEYAIGGPTVEMLMKSYSQKHDVDYRAQASSNTGYQISEDGGANWANNYSGMLDTSDSLYVISSTERAYAMWIASPSADNPDYVMLAGYRGYVDCDYYTNDGIGFRPLVCLNSNVQLKKNSDGTYAIK